jgi:hypothetical protein
MDDHRGQAVKWGKILGWVLSLAALGFIGKWIVGLKHEVWQTLAHLHPAWLALSLVLFLIWFGLRFIAWDRISRSQGYGGERRTNLRMWAISELMRYIPGNVWSFAARYKGSREGGAARSSSIIALIVEALSLVSGAAIVTLVSRPHGWLLAVCLGIIVVSVAILIILPHLKKMPRFAEMKPIPNAFGLVVWYVLVWVTFGLAAATIWKAFPQANLMGWLNALSANVAAWLAGYLSLITPMGLGVREVAFVGLVPAALGVSLASLVALVTRLWMIVSELVFVSIVVVWTRRK